MTSTTPLTGEQYTIRHGDYEATVCEQGAILRVLRWQGTDLIAPFDPDKPVPCCNGYMLVPYPNRIEGGRYTFEGRTYQFPIDEPDRDTSLHGTGYRSFWVCESKSDDSVTLVWRNAADAVSYPFKVRARVRYTLTDDGLELSMTGINDGTVDAPWAFGIHPWLSNGKNLYGNDPILEQNAKCSLRLGARTHVTVDGNLVPNGTESVENTRFDLRHTTVLGDLVFDDAWTDVDRDEDGYSSATFTRPDGVSLTLRADRTFNAWQVCTGTGFPAESHPSGVAVEPMTAYANAFRTGKDLVTLRPGQEYTSVIRFSATKD